MEITNTETETVVENVPQADPEVERLTAENEALKNEMRVRGAVYDLEARLAASGARSPGLLAATATERLQFGEDGRLSNTEALIEWLRRAYPEQFGRDVPSGSIDAGAGRNAPPPLTREALAAMTPDEIRSLEWEEIKEVLSVK